MIHLLTLDLAGRLGWARWREGQKDPVWGALDVPTKISNGADFAKFRDWLMAEVVMQQVTHICAETIFVSEKTASAAPRLYGLLAVSEEVAYRKGVAFSKAMSGDWRGHFLGQRTAPKSIPAKKRRDWWKSEAVAECKKRGWAVKTNDEADALGILVYERARLLPAFGVEGDLLSIALMREPLGCERVA